MIRNEAQKQADRSRNELIKQADSYRKQAEKATPSERAVLLRKARNYYEDAGCGNWAKFCQRWMEK